MMNNELEQEQFSIDNDVKAEWAIKKIAEERAELQRYINVCETMINEYKAKIEERKQKSENNTSWLESELFRYFNTIEKKKETKTQVTYELPSGKLLLKKSTTEFVRDDEKLLEYLKNNKQEQYIKVKESIDWTNFKKILSITDDTVIDEDGQVVEGITLQEKQAKFEIEI